MSRLPRARQGVRLKGVLQQAPVGVVLLDGAGRILDHNGPARELLALDPATDVGTPLVAFFPVEERLRVERLLHVETGADAVRLRVRTPAGERLVDASASRSGLRNRTWRMVFLHDVTRVVRADEDLREQTALYEAILRAQSDVGVGFVLVEGTRTLYVNQAVCRLTGFSREELLELPFSSLLPPEPVGGMQEGAQPAVLPPDGDGRVWESALPRRGGGTVEVEVAFHVLDAGRDPRTVVILRDVTEKKRHEREMEEARRDLQRADRLSVLGGLVSGVAHEIRTPLTLISNHIHLIEHEVRKAAAEGQLPRPLLSLPGHVAAARDGVDRIAHLVKDLRRFMKMGGPLKSEGTISEAVLMAVSLFEATHHGSHVRIEARVEATRPIVADASQVQQVVLNLLENAVEASPRGGVVRITLRDVSEGVELLVSDRGTGIPSDVLERMFDAFVTTKPEGTGLGLAIVRRIVEGHGGSLGVDTAVGSGTTVRVSLPRRPAPLLATPGGS